MSNDKIVYGVYNRDESKPCGPKKTYTHKVANTYNGKTLVLLKTSKTRQHPKILNSGKL